MVHTYNPVRYILTPLFDKLNNHILDKQCPLWYSIITLVALSVVVKLFIPYFNPAWISCFYIGYIFDAKSDQFPDNGSSSDLY